MQVWNVRIEHRRLAILTLLSGGQGLVVFHVLLVLSRRSLDLFLGQADCEGVCLGYDLESALLVDGDGSTGIDDADTQTGEEDVGREIEADATTIDRMQVAGGVRERRGDLVLDRTDRHIVTGRSLIAPLVRSGRTTAGAHSKRVAELECLASCGVLLLLEWLSTDLLTHLVDEEEQSVGLVRECSEVGKFLSENASTVCEEASARLCIDCALRSHRRNRVEHDDRTFDLRVLTSFHEDGPGVREHGLKREHSVRGHGLRDRHEIEIDTESFCVATAERVLKVEVDRGDALSLCVCDGRQAERGLTGRLMSGNLDDATARPAADTECKIERDRTSLDPILDRPETWFPVEPTELGDRLLVLRGVGEEVRHLDDGERFLLLCLLCHCDSRPICSMSFLLICR